MNTVIRKVVYTTLIGTMFSILPLSLQAKVPMRGPAPFSAYDINKNGVITKKEFNKFHAHRLRERAKIGIPMRNAKDVPGFNFFDANRNGRITHREFANAQRAIMQQKRGGPMMDKHPIPSPMANKAKKRGPTPFSAYDINKNGVITKKEFYKVREIRMAMRAKSGRPMKNAGNTPKFSFFDLNGDGVISRKEYKIAHRDRMQKRMMQRDGYGMGMGKGMGRGSMGNQTGMGKGPNR